MQTTWTGTIQSSHGLCIVYSSPPSIFFTSFPPILISPVSLVSNKKLPPTWARVKLSPPRLRQHVSSATPHIIHKIPIRGSKRTCIPSEPAVAFNDLQLIPSVTRFLPAWTLAKSNTPIFRTLISLSAPSILNSLLLLTDVIQPLKNHRKDPFIT